MAQNTQGNTFLLVVILIALLAVAGLMISQQSPPPTSQVRGIENTADLEKASMELDSVNVDAMDSGLNELSRDAAAI